VSLRSPPFPFVSPSFSFVSVPFRLPVTPTPEAIPLASTRSSRASSKRLDSRRQRVASPEWLNASRLGRNARTGGTATSRTLQHQSRTLTRTAAAWCISVTPSLAPSARRKGLPLVSRALAPPMPMPVPSTCVVPTCVCASPLHLFIYFKSEFVFRGAYNSAQRRSRV
jgi:hypothetical protein